mmetsp:Transcript_17738/g.16969  ORF Transcript_17738/g.16969 Transcript_17738/m.16969 type:complete len:248 (-) Transcript_17738:2-745(-)
MLHNIHLEGGQSQVKEETSAMCDSDQILAQLQLALGWELYVWKQEETRNINFFELDREDLGCLFYFVKNFLVCLQRAHLCKHWHPLVLLRITRRDSMHTDPVANVIDARLVVGSTHVLDEDEVVVVLGDHIPGAVQRNRQTRVLPLLHGGARDQQVRVQWAPRQGEIKGILIKHRVEGSRPIQVILVGCYLQDSFIFNLFQLLLLLLVFLIVFVDQRGGLLGELGLGLGVGAREGGGDPFFVQKNSF